MSLTGRFSTLFLGTLAVALAAFSTSIYVAAQIHLERRVAERVTDALGTLAAAAEIHPEGVEWEPGERFLPLGEEDGPEQLRWMIFDDQGHRVDRSVNLVEADLTDDWAARPDGESRLTDRRGRSWLVGRRQILGGRPGRTGSQVAARSTAPPVMDPPVLFFPRVDIVAYASLEPVASTLASLAWFLVILSASVWLLAALLSRRLSRHALAPLRRLAASARGLDATDPGWCLEEAGTGDELEELGRTFNDLLSRLHLAYERQRSFSGNASHQLRTPLTSLIGQIEVALRKDRPAEEYRRVLGAALSRAVQLARISEALLFLAQNESDTQLPCNEVLDLATMAQDHINDLLDSGRFETPVQVVPAGRPLPIRADSTLLVQLLDNLLDNARKYGGSDCSVLVEARRDGQSALLAVEDSGPGIPPEDSERVFEPFYRSPDARGRGIPGAGLGLAVVHRIATALGGSARVCKGAMRGCRVEIRLPLAADQSTTEQDPAARPVAPLQQLSETQSAGTFDKAR